MAHGVSVSCPSCGVTIKDTSAHTRSLACPHCGNWVYLGSNGWESAGLFEHAIDAPSIFLLGKSGQLSQRAFVVAGRVRLSYGEDYREGFWDEWWLEFEDGNHQWLEEDDGAYRLHKSSDVGTGANSGADSLAHSQASSLTSSLAGASVGSNLSIDGKDWFVSERLEAIVAGVQGSLPVAITPGEKVICIDVMGNGTRLSIEASDNEVQISDSDVVRASAFKWR